MPDGGVLRIDTGRAHLSEERRQVSGARRLGDHVCLTVGDTGIGMDAETQTRIFEPFFTTNPPGKGTGLGLHTVSGLVTRHVVSTTDGLEALEALRHTAGVQLVFSDVVMPRLSGRALYDAARREGFTTPFLFASGYSDPERAAKLDPTIPLLNKPWTESDLLGRIREILDREKGEGRGGASAATA